MSKKQIILHGTFVLTAAGIISRIMGFFYRIFLSRTFSAEGVGLYQLIFPVYTLCLSITTAGIETAISRSVARQYSMNKEKESINTLLSGIFCSLILSFLCVFIINRNVSFIASTLLGDPRCESLLKLLIYVLPFSTIHNCISGFYYGLKSSRLPALSQLIEQSSRILIVLLLYRVFTENGTVFPLSVAVFGIIAGEAVSAVYSIFIFRKFALSRHFTFMKDFSGKSFHELVSLSIPLTLNRLLVNLLQSIEAISIPARLETFCSSSSEALSTYGILNGMALPCILFPSAVTTSAASMLMPTIAEIQTSGNRKEFINVTKKVCGVCFILGLSCCFIFLISGRWIGSHLFHEESAGNFIITLAWICPFLYTNTALLSVINGLGKTKCTLLINVIGLSIRISSVYFAIPVFGIKGYLWGLLASQLTICLAAIYALYVFYRDFNILQHSQNPNK